MMDSRITALSMEIQSIERFVDDIVSSAFKKLDELDKRNEKVDISSWDDLQSARSIEIINIQLALKMAYYEMNAIMEWEMGMIVCDAQRDERISAAVFDQVTSKYKYNKKVIWDIPLGDVLF